MNHDQPFVSILLPICNQAQFLSDCLASLTEQSYDNIEVIAIDDASKDKSYSILKSFKKKDKRIRTFKNIKRYGMAICLNRALKKAKGNFIAFMNANDVSTRDRIIRQVRFLLANPTTVAVGTQTVTLNENNKKRNTETFPKHNEEIVQGLLPGTSIQFETAMINKHVLPKDLLSFNHNTYPMIFSDLFSKLPSYGNIANLPWILYLRRRTINTSKNNIPNILQLTKLWVTSFTNHDYRFPIKTIFAPLAR